MNPLDLVAILLVVVAVILGFQSGALPQVGGLLGAVGGGALVVLALPHLVEPLEAVPVSIRPYVVLGGLLMAVGIGESVGSAIGRTGAFARRRLPRCGRPARRERHRGCAGAPGHLAGGWATGPRTPRTAQRGCPDIVGGQDPQRRPAPPTEIAGVLARLLNDSGLPDVFVGFEPLPRPPVDTPSDTTAGRIAGAAEASTVRVRAGVCGAQASGTGAVVGEGYVVTNAHVVAGARWCHRRRDSSRRPDRCARGPVRSGTRRRVLWAPDLQKPLRFASGDPDRGAVGAALGYPGGGSLTSCRRP